MDQVHDGVHEVVRGPGMFCLHPVLMMMVIHVTHLQGFKYFALYLRGREELICRVLNEPMVSALTNKSFITTLNKNDLLKKKINK